MHRGNAGKEREERKEMTRCHNSAQIVYLAGFVHRIDVFSAQQGRRGITPFTHRDAAPIAPAMELETSPLALPFPQMPSIAGTTLRVSRAHYKDWDLSLIHI